MRMGKKILTYRKWFLISLFSLFAWLGFCINQVRNVSGFKEFCFLDEFLFAKYFSRLSYCLCQDLAAWFLPVSLLLKPGECSWKNYLNCISCDFCLLFVLLLKRLTWFSGALFWCGQVFSLINVFIRIARSFDAGQLGNICGNF